MKIAKERMQIVANVTRVFDKMRVSALTSCQHMDSHADGNMEKVKVFCRNIKPTIHSRVNFLRGPIAEFNRITVQILKFICKHVVSIFVDAIGIVTFLCRETYSAVKKICLWAHKLFLLMAEFVCIQARRFAKYMAELAKKLQMFIEIVLVPAMKKVCLRGV
jgi:hypothetical protein